MVSPRVARLPREALGGLSVEIGGHRDPIGQSSAEKLLKKIAKGISYLRQAIESAA